MIVPEVLNCYLLSSLLTYTRCSLRFLFNATKDSLSSTPYLTRTTYSMPTRSILMTCTKPADPWLETRRKDQLTLNLFKMMNEKKKRLIATEFQDLVEADMEEKPRFSHRCTTRRRSLAPPKLITTKRTVRMLQSPDYKRRSLLTSLDFWLVEPTFNHS